MRRLSALQAIAILLAATLARGDGYVDTLTFLASGGGGGGGSVPVIETTATGAHPTTVATATHTLPAGLTGSDELVLVTALDDGDANNAFACPTDSPTYTKTVATDTTQGLATTYTCHKVTDGSDAAVTTWTGNESGAIGALRISGVTGAITTATAFGNAEPVNCAAVSYTAPALVIIVVSVDAARTVTTGAAGYTDVIANASNGGTSGTTLHVQSIDKTTGTSEDPGDMDLVQSDDWSCITMALEG